MIVGLWLAISIACDFLVPLLRADIHQGDAAQHVFWTYRFIDPQLFPNDLSALYFSQPHFASMGWRAIFQSLVRWIDPQTLSELLAVLLVVPTVGFSILIGRRTAGPLGGVVAVAMLLASGGLQLLAGGFARSFALPIVLLAVWSIVARRAGWLGLSFLLAGLFYPPTLLIVGGFALACGVVHVCRERMLSSEQALSGERTMVPRAIRAIGRWEWIAIILGAAVACAIVGWSYLRPPLPEIGSAYTIAEARQMPEFGRGGRTAFFRPWHVMYFHQAYAGMGLTTRAAAAWAGLLLLTLVLARRAISRECTALLISSLSLFAAAHLLAFHLYLPSRYTLYTFPIIAILWAAGVTRSIGRHAVWVTLPICVAAMLFSTRSIERAHTRWTEHPWPRPAGFESAYAFIAGLPIDTLIAAHPDDADDIPLRARRSVLANTETSNAWHRNYYPQIARRIDASLRMCYAADWSEIDTIADTFGVTAFLVNTARFDPKHHVEYHSPFGPAMREQITRSLEQIAGSREQMAAAGDAPSTRPASGFAFSNIPADRVLLSASGVVLVRVGTSDTHTPPRDLTKPEAR